MGVSYGTREGVRRLGIPLGRSARAVASVDAGADTIEIANHALSTDDPVQWQVDASSTLPGPFVVGTVYYAKPVADSDSLLQLAATAGGAAISITTAGSGSLRLFSSNGPLIDELLEYYSRWFDGKAIAHGVPFEAPYPVEVVKLVECRTAAHMARIPAGKGAEGERLYEQEAMMLRDVDAMVRGIRIRDAAVTTSSTNVPVYASAGSATYDPGTVP